MIISPPSGGGGNGNGKGPGGNGPPGQGGPGNPGQGGPGNNMGGNGKGKGIGGGVGGGRKDDGIAAVEAIDISTLGNPTYLTFDMTGYNRADVYFKNVTKSPTGTRPDYIQFGTATTWLSAASSAWRHINGSNNARSQQFTDIPIVSILGGGNNSVLRIVGFGLDNGRPGVMAGRLNDQYATGIGIITAGKYTRFRLFTSNSGSAPDGTVYTGGTVYIQRR